MTRIDSVRAATGSAKGSVLHAAEAVAPYADTAKDRAAHYAHEARVRLAPKMSQAADQARLQYDAYVVPRLEQARTHVPPKMDQAAQEAAVRARLAARQAAEYSRPVIERSVAAAGPVREEAAIRGAAALAALRGQVTAEEIRRLSRRHKRRARAGRVARMTTMAGLVVGAALAAWKWWDKQANPDWLVEPPEATEVPESGRLTSVDGTGPTVLDPEVRAEHAKNETSEDGDESP